MSSSDSPREHNLLPSGHLVAGRYEIRRSLGSGGMGCVYLASDQVLGEDNIAIKILHAEHAYEQKHTQRFLREVQLMRKVNNPNVVRTFDVGADGDLVYFTMEYVSGESLEDMIQKRSFPEDLLPELVIHVCEGLGAIHKAGIIHRDLKPGNIMVKENGEVKITDFGVARPEVSNLTAHNEIIGSSLYMAPEIWLGRKLSGSVDLYSLGIILYEVTTGLLPFDGDSPASVMQQHLDRMPKPPREINKNIKPWLNKLILKLMAKSILDRPRNAEEVIETVKNQQARQSGGTAAYLAQGPASGSSTVSKSFISTLESLSESAVASNESTETRRKKDSWVSYLRDGLRGPLRSLFISKVRRRMRGTGTVKGVLPILTHQLSALVATGCLLVILGAALNYLFGHLLEPIPSLDMETQGVVVREFTTGKALRIGAPYGLLFVILLSLPVTLLGALSGSMFMAARAFAASLIYFVITGIALTVYHLSPVLGSEGVNGVSLLSAGQAAGRLLSQIALLSPFISDFKHLVLSKGMLLVEQNPIPVTSFTLVGIAYFAYVVCIAYVIGKAFNSKSRQPGFAHVLIALAMVMLLLIEVRMYDIARLELKTVTLLGFDFSLPYTGWLIALCTWAGLYTLVAVFFARAEYRRRYG